MKSIMNYWKSDNDNIEKFAKGFFQSCGKSYSSSFRTTRNITSKGRKGKVKRK